MNTLRGLVILGIAAGVGCGGEVVVDGPPEPDTTSASASASAGSGSSQCSIGACGDNCVACNFEECLPGFCSESGECLFSVECPVD